MLGQLLAFCPASTQGHTQKPFKKMLFYRFLPTSQNRRNSLFGCTPNSHPSFFQRGCPIRMAVGPKPQAAGRANRFPCNGITVGTGWVPALVLHDDWCRAFLSAAAWCAHVQRVQAQPQAGTESLKDSGSGLKQKDYAAHRKADMQMERQLFEAWL